MRAWTCFDAGDILGWCRWGVWGGVANDTLIASFYPLLLALFFVTGKALLTQAYGPRVQLWPMSKTVLA